MDYHEFTESLNAAEPPAGLAVPLKSLWYDAKGDWYTAHELVQDLDDKYSARIHAYLHRKESDIFNADYWYRRAGTNRPGVSLEVEWREMIEAFLIGFR